MVAISTERTKREKRKLGAYYTPLTIAQPTVDWAIRDKNDKILDPSFGGCDFLNLAIQKLVNIGSESAAENVYGCDIDPYAESFANAIISKGAPVQNFKFEDFISSKYESKFDVIIGNPPYIKHDNIPHKLLEAAEAIAHKFGLHIIKPNYWVYFILKSLDLLKDNGRLVFVLPRTIMNAKYSEAVKDLIGQSFEKVFIIPIAENAFDKTDEKVIILLCEGFKNGSTAIEYINTTSLSNLNNVIFSPDKSNSIQENVKSIIDSSTKDLIYSNLKDLYKIKIGIVTGGKDFFIHNLESVSRLGIPNFYFKPVVTKSDQLTLENLFTYSDSDRYVLTVPKDYIPHSIFSNKNLDTYLASATEELLNSHHCKVRKPWYHIPRLDTPSLIIKNIVTYDTILYPERMGAVYTNNFITLYSLNKDLDSFMHTIYSMTSLFQLQAEYFGLHYGKSGLKLDPRHLSHIRVPTVISMTYDDLKSIKYNISILKGSDFLSYIDQIVLKKYLGLSDSTINEIRTHLDTLRVLRQIN